MKIETSLENEYAFTAGQRLPILLLFLILAVPVLGVLLYIAKVTLEPVTANPTLQVFGVSFLSILFEAAPFVLFGVILSGLIESFVSPQVLLRFVPRSRFGQLLAGAVAGVIIPVCECGIIVVVRRLLKKGLPLQMALAYMLVAPIVNPICIASTFAAYRGRSVWLLMPVARVVLGIGLGMLIAAFVGRTKLADALQQVPSADAASPGPVSSLRQKLSAVGDHAVNEFIDVSVFLILGAGVAALVQTLVARDLLTGVGHSPVLAVPSMMGLALLVNLCSEADAFVAASFSVTFSFASQLAFLVLGPMLDLKLAIMYTMAFRRRTIVKLILAIVVTVFVAVELVALAEYFWGGP